MISPEIEVVHFMYITILVDSIYLVGYTFTKPWHRKTNLTEKDGTKKKTRKKGKF